MSATRDMVREFHAAFGVKEERSPCVEGRAIYGITYLRAATHHFRAQAIQPATGDVRALRLALLTEELTELAEALSQEQPVSALDALCDLQYVLDGTVLALGMGNIADEAFRRVHASNMSKLGPDGEPVLNEFGKVVKGPNYVPVYLEDLVK